MKKFVLALLLCPMLGIQAQAQPAPFPPAEPTAPGPRMGAYAPTSLDSPLVQDARAFIQTRLASMVLDDVTEAYTQVVAGLNVKLVCSVQDEDGINSWQFVAFRSLDGRWHFHSATRI